MRGAALCDSPLGLQLTPNQQGEPGWLQLDLSWELLPSAALGNWL